jgi:hypothetical protein
MGGGLPVTTLEERLNVEREARTAKARERQAFLKGVNADFAALRRDPKAWAEELAEQESLDGTLMDGLEGE